MTELEKIQVKRGGLLYDNTRVLSLNLTFGMFAVNAFICKNREEKKKAGKGSN